MPKKLTELQREIEALRAIAVYDRVGEKQPEDQRYIYTYCPKANNVGTFINSGFSVARTYMIALQAHNRVFACKVNDSVFSVDWWGRDWGAIQTHDVDVIIQVVRVWGEIDPRDIFQA